MQTFLRYKKRAGGFEMVLKRWSGSSMTLFVAAFLLCGTAFFCTPGGDRGREPPSQTGSVVFIHPDGSSAAMWAALRMLDRGPDGMTHWDSLEEMGLYRGHLRDSTNASSQGGATTHAYGVKARFHNYGIDPENPFDSLSGKPMSIMEEAKEAGKAVAIINSGHICEPGTGVFMANAPDRNMTDVISEQIIESGADIIMAGGEVFLLPEGEVGVHGQPGRRGDGKNLIRRAERLGYRVVFTRDEMMGLPPEADKVLGVFSAGHTFNDKPEQVLAEQDLPLYNSTAPSTAEMLSVTLQIMERRGRDFLIVLEEEGSDNFANVNNARGVLEALRRADAAIGEALDFLSDHPDTLLITAADSNAGAMHIVNVRNPEDFEKPLPPRMTAGSPLDGKNGEETLPFVAQPDQFGNRLRFGIAWASLTDGGGGVLARASGFNAELLPAHVDNTDIYRIMYRTLFGEAPDK
jgi:alkaline phosphatase